VPPGRDGHQPTVELRYSSRSPLRGGIAAGWTLPIPTISVDTSVGRAQGVRYEAGGARLVQVTEPAATGGPAGVTYYRAERDTTYTRYEKWPDPQGGSYWIARSLDGTVTTYGAGPSAKDVRTEGTPGDPLFGDEGRWFVTSVVDGSGNAITYS